MSYFGRDTEPSTRPWRRDPELPVRVITEEEDRAFRSREGRGLMLFEPRIDTYSYIARRSFNNPLEARKEHELIKPKRHEAVEFIQDYFELNPKASVSDCARVASAAKVQASIDLISSVKNMLRQQQAAVKPTPVVKPEEPRAFNPLKMPETVLKIVPAPVAPPPEAPEVKVEVKLEGEALKQAKVAYLNEILDKEPGISVRKIQEMLKERHGGSLNPMYILDTMKVAKELAGIVVTRGGNQYKPKKETAPVPTPVAKTPAPTAQTPMPTNPRMVTWSEGGAFRFEVAKLEETQARVLTLMGKGIDSKTIQVWKLTNFKVSIDIE